MEFLRQLIEARIAQRLGMPVSMGSFSASPFSGRVEVTNLVVGTLIRVERVVATISLTRLLKREVSIQSLQIRSPQITLSGPLLNPPLTPPPNDLPKSASPGDDRAWSVRLETAQITDGRIAITVPKAGDYAFGIAGLDGTIRYLNGAYELAATAQSVGRLDEPVEIGAAKLSGRLAGEAGEAQLQIGTLLDARAQSTSIKTGPWGGSVQLTIALEILMRLLPATVKLPVAKVAGEATLLAAATVGRERRVTIDRFALSTRDAVLN